MLTAADSRGEVALAKALPSISLETLKAYGVLLEAERRLKGMHSDLIVRRIFFPCDYLLAHGLVRVPHHIMVAFYRLQSSFEGSYDYYYEDSETVDSEAEEESRRELASKLGRAVVVPRAAASSFDIDEWFRDRWLEAKADRSNSPDKSNIDEAAANQEQDTASSRSSTSSSSSKEGTPSDRSSTSSSSSE